MSKFKNKYRIESARRPNFDYQNVGYYFVTICTFQRQHFFGEIVNGEMVHTAVGLIAHEYFLAIPEHTKAICTIDTHQIMPNHAHGIIAIEHAVETLHCNVSTTIDPQMSAISPKTGSLSAIVRSYKSAVSYWCSQNGHTDFGWQTRFHDRVIRNDRELEAIRAYILANPANWEKDRENDSGLFM
ncbi:MAG: transposase [Anaerolineaceae bacterium]|nr:transposase [Anaerolineaceae bacterium]